MFVIYCTLCGLYIGQLSNFEIPPLARQCYKRMDGYASRRIHEVDTLHA